MKPRYTKKEMDSIFKPLTPKERKRFQEFQAHGGDLALGSDELAFRLHEVFNRPRPSRGLSTYSPEVVKFNLPIAACAARTTAHHNKSEPPRNTSLVGS